MPNSINFWRRMQNIAVYNARLQKNKPLSFRLSEPTHSQIDRLNYDLNQRLTDFTGLF